MVFTKIILENLYLKKQKSVPQIAKLFECSDGRVNYWLKKYKIKKRSISSAIYIRCNPTGDPFNIHDPSNIEEAKLFGLGLGLYWGEGTKSNKYSVRLGNTDPGLIKKFIEFLVCVCDVNKDRLRFGLQIFTDMSVKSSLDFWVKKLNVNSSSFQKVVVTPKRGVGSYLNKTKYGVLTVYFHNKKLRDIICGMIDDLR